MLGGERVIEIEGERHDVKAGSYAFINNNLKHQFINTGTETFYFFVLFYLKGINAYKHNREFK